MLDAESITIFSYVAAFVGGLISFASPCVLPVVPGYLSVISGLDFAEIQRPGRTNTFPIVRDTGLFIAGFGSVFIALGVSATAFGRLVVDNQAALTRISGALVLAMALFMLGSMYLKAPWLYQERRFHPNPGRFGRAAPAVAGVAFGFGWTPCIGPILTSILAVAATSGRATTGASLLAVYALGLGIPFLLAGLFFSRLSGSFSWLRSNMNVVVLFSASLLAVFGVLLIFDRLTWVTSQVQRLLTAVGLESLVNIG
jgi:cytochrome c-type biogenesis protein